MPDDLSALKVTPRPLDDGSGWYVEIAWPNGRVERIGTFGLETTARDWIENDFPAYFRDELAR